MAGNTTLVTKDGMVKVCRLIGFKLYCIEFNEDVKARDIEAYWQLNDEEFKVLGRSTKCKESNVN